MIGDYTLDQLISCDFGRWDVPFFDGDCRTYMNDYVTVQSVLDCMVWFDRGLTSTTITIVANDMAVDPSALELDTFSLVWTVLSIGQNFRHDLNSILKTNYFITDWYNNYEIQNHQALTFDGIDGVEINLTGGDTVELGLVAPAAQYYTPGRCVDGSATNARRAGRLAGMATRVTISADVAWAAGNTIVLLFNGTDTIADVVLAWNTANPANTVTVTGGDDTQIPADQEYIQLHNGSDEVSCLPGEYYPFNRWLVLTRDCVTNQAQWIPPQCCLQTLNFVGGNITIDIDIAWPDISSINTDNQQLTLTSDALRPSVNHHDTLCLSRRHGGALGVQIPDPDSCVDLRDINEHTFDIQGNLLYLLGSDLLINSVVDLSQVNEHTLDLQSDPIDPAHYHDPLFPRHDILDILGSDWLSNGIVDLNHVAQEMLTLQDRLLCVRKIIDNMPTCQSCKEQCVDLWITNYTCEDVMQCINYDAVVDWSDYPGICGAMTDPAYAAEREAFFCNGPVTINNTWIFINTWIQNITTILYQISEIIKRQKYRARIYPTSNRMIRSGHAVHSDLITSLDGGNYARWYFPNFDGGEWWHSSTTETIDPARAIVDSVNHIHIGTFDQVLPNSGAGYSTSPSANNPNLWVEGKACNWGSNTIRIPMTWRYDLNLIGTLEVDHNVHAYRYSVLRLRAAENHTKVDFLMDTKFGGDPSVGSHSVNDTAYPQTKQYNHAANKIMYLERWDILFVAVRIDPVTFWPTLTDQQDYLMNNSGGGFAELNHTPGNASGMYVSRTPGSLSLTYSSGLYWYRDGKTYTDSNMELPWPASMPPHLNYSVYYAAFGWMNWAENYNYNLTLSSSGNTDYHYDDGCVNVLANPSFAQSDWSGVSPSWFYTPAANEKYGGSMLSVHRVNFEQ